MSYDVEWLLLPLSKFWEEDPEWALKTSSELVSWLNLDARATGPLHPESCCQVFIKESVAQGTVLCGQNGQENLSVEERSFCLQGGEHQAAYGHDSVYFPQDMAESMCIAAQMAPGRTWLVQLDQRGVLGRFFARACNQNICNYETVSNR